MIDQLLYKSDANSKMNDAEWERIQRSTQIYNAVNGIYGLCCYDGEGFIQLIEARIDKVDAAMKRIRGDHCHDNIDILYHQPSDFARYGKFHMLFSKVSSDSAERRQDADRLVVPTLAPELKRLICDWFERTPGP